MTLQDHEAKKPVRSKPIKDMTPPEYKQWSEAMSVWLWERDGIIASEMVKGMETPGEVREKVMREKACLPRADYEYREIPKRKHRAKKPAWSGSSKVYNATAKEKSRAKQAVTMTYEELQDRQERARASRAKYRAKKRAEKEAQNER